MYARRKRRVCAREILEVLTCNKGSKNLNTAAVSRSPSPSPMPRPWPRPSPYILAAGSCTSCKSPRRPSSSRDRFANTRQQLLRTASWMPCPEATANIACRAPALAKISRRPWLSSDFTPNVFAAASPSGPATVALESRARSNFSTTSLPPPTAQSVSIDVPTWAALAALIAQESAGPHDTLREPLETASANK